MAAGSDDEEALLVRLAKYTAKLSSDAEAEEFVRLCSDENASRSVVEARISYVLSERAALRQKKKRQSLLPTAFMLLVVSGGALASLLNGWNQSSSASSRGVEQLDQSLFKTVISPRKPTDTDWVVFYYKPYCGACRRVRPFFHALARSTNYTKLRFGEIDCVRWRPLCRHAGAKSQPAIKIYSKQGDSRREVATWQGVLIAYEILGWFVRLQNAGILPSDIGWADDQTLAEEMLRFKTAEGYLSRDISIDKRSVEDVDAAWRMALVDAVFQKSDSLEGRRLLAMADFLDALAYSLPKKRWRATTDSLRASLADKIVWTPRDFDKLLKKHGVEEPSNWDGEGRCGGYTCSLWTLFHAMIANSDRHGAPHVLKGIKSWIVEFFGCSECSKHFEDMWRDRDGEDASDAVSSALWLWRAHNLVSARVHPTRPPWPTNETCKTCFKSYNIQQRQQEVNRAEARKSTKRGEDEDFGGEGELLGETTDSTLQLPLDEEGDYDEGFVFRFLSETYCLDSDTFVCAAFDRSDT